MSAVSLIETPPTPELKEFYERIEGASRGFGVLNVFKVMAHSPELMKAWWGMMAVALSRLKLAPRLRELAILRLFQVKPAEYGFAHHVRIGRDLGITDEDVAALATHAENGHFSELDALVLRYTDAVTTLADDSPAIAAELRAHLSEQELVELTFCIANWNLMAHLLAPLEIELEPGVREFLPEGWDGKGTAS
ncbi:MAG: carboxymuconolactone decarboxylase family protein [Chloroflexi bacterium]|nr:carboxymuconolactone decarboxylase family protein [Chloroflexota bacterium]